MSGTETKAAGTKAAGTKAAGTKAAVTKAAVTIEDLRRWEEHGAIWRAREVSDQRAVVELCTCSGEPVDLVESDAAELIEFVRDHRSR